MMLLLRVCFVSCIIFICVTVQCKRYTRHLNICRSFVRFTLFVCVVFFLSCLFAHLIHFIFIIWISKFSRFLNTILCDHAIIPLRISILLWASIRIFATLAKSYEIFSLFFFKFICCSGGAIFRHHTSYHISTAFDFNVQTWPIRLEHKILFDFFLFLSRVAFDCLYVHTDDLTGRVKAQLSINIDLWWFFWW